MNSGTDVRHHDRIGTFTTNNGINVRSHKAKYLAGAYCTSNPNFRMRKSKTAKERYHGATTDHSVC